MPYELPPDAMMSTQGPMGMGNPFTNMMKRMMNRPKDIELPAETGMVDPRILEQSVNPLEQLKKAFGAAQNVAAEDDALKGLYRAGGR